MDMSFTHAFIGGAYKKHRETVLIDRERSLLPATMAFAEYMLTKIKLLAERKKLRTRYNRVTTQKKLYLKFSATNKQDAEIKKAYNEIKLEHTQLKFQIEHVVEKVRLLELSHLLSVRAGSVQASVTTKEEARKFTRACPADGCRGFLSTQWKCGLCELWTCPDCHEVIGIDKNAANHTCKQENVESAKLIAKDSRPCPSCASLIFKIEGCDQMFCVQCHTAFSWRTGRVETGTIHNPHYYEFMRKNNGGIIPRAPGDEECGGVPNIQQFILKLKNTYANLDDYPNELLQALQLYNHIQHNELRGNFLLPNIGIVNRVLRARFLIKEIDEDKFKKLLQQHEKKYEKIKEARFTMSMFNTALGDMLRRVYAETSTTSVHELINEMNELRTYTNRCFESAAARYKCKAPHLHTDKWSLRSVNWF
jgi:hypothetical protein